MVLHQQTPAQSMVSCLLMDSERLRELGHIDEEACRRFTTTVEFAGRKLNAAILLAGVRGARRFSEMPVTACWPRAFASSNRRGSSSGT